MRLLPIALALAMVAGLSLACGQEEDPPPAARMQAAGTPTAMPSSPAVKGQLWRWVNVTVVAPEGSDVTIGRGTVPTDVRPEGGPGLGPVIQHGGDPAKASYVIIDAVTGDVLQDRVASEDRAAIDEVLRTLAVSPFDAAVKSWPYQGELPAEAQRQRSGGISYVVPDPASGVEVGGGIADPTGSFIRISNGRSTMLISLDTQTGALSPQAVAMSPQDEAPFDRYLSSVRVCGRDLQC